MDMNKAIQRSLTKAAARHGLGLYIYAGEDLPETPAEGAENAAETAKPARTKKTPTAPEKKAGAAKKTVITDKNIKQVVDWVCQVPEGDQRDARIAKAEQAYEWPGELLNAFLTMVDLSK